MAVLVHVGVCRTAVVYCLPCLLRLPCRAEFVLIDDAGLDADHKAAAAAAAVAAAADLESRRSER